MNIPEITAEQLEWVKKGANTFFLIVPDIHLDKGESLTRWTESNRDVNYLIDLGLLDDVSAMHSDDIKEWFGNTGRQIRVFEATREGYHLGIAECSPAVN